jgi:hypothetical protein
VLPQVSQPRPPRTFESFRRDEFNAIGLHENTPDHLLLDSAPNLGPLISRWEINKFENC